MTRPIDADALHEIRFTDIFNENVRHSKSKLYMLGWNDAIDAIIYDTPTVDAVPVIRCKDCVNCGTDDCAMHFEIDDKVYQWNRADDFCSLGERKEHEID
jgi:hypothetical protein